MCSQLDLWNTNLYSNENHLYVKQTCVLTARPLKYQSLQQWKSSVCKTDVCAHSSTSEIPIFTAMKSSVCKTDVCAHSPASEIPIFTAMKSSVCKTDVCAHGPASEIPIFTAMKSSVCKTDVCAHGPAFEIPIFTKKRCQLIEIFSSSLKHINSFKMFCVRYSTIRLAITPIEQYNN